MVRQLEPTATAEDRAELRASTEALCRDLEDEIARFEAGTAAEGDLRQSYMNHDTRRRPSRACWR